MKHIKKNIKISIKKKNLTRILRNLTNFLNSTQPQTYTFYLSLYYYLSSVC